MGAKFTQEITKEDAIEAIVSRMIPYASDKALEDVLETLNDDNRQHGCYLGFGLCNFKIVGYYDKCRCPSCNYVNTDKYAKYCGNCGNTLND